MEVVTHFAICRIGIGEEGNGNKRSKNGLIVLESGLSLNEIISRKKTTCAPNKDTEQPGRSPSLVRVFAVSIGSAKTLSYLLSTRQGL